MRYQSFLASVCDLVHNEIMAIKLQFGNGLFKLLVAGSRTLIAGVERTFVSWFAFRFNNQSVAEQLK